MRVALLTCRELPLLTDDDRLVVAPLEQRGARVEVCAWDEARAWDLFDLVVVRSTWDYHERPERFLEALQTIGASAARLVNELDLMRWNLDKRYLRELQEKGVPIVETEWRGGLEPGDLASIASGFEGRAFVIKPVVGASAHDAFLLDASSAAARSAEITPRFAGRALMVQPYMARIASEGEYSVSAFAGALSHAALKKPGAGDYRVQEEHGGSLHPVALSDELREASRAVLEALESPPPYARVDLVRDESGELRLMELELVEPDLFLRVGPGSPDRFAAALLGAAKRPV